jgi:hypothetical protein
MGEIAAGGRVYPDPSNQCAPYSPPYIFTLQLGLQMLRGKNHITMLYQQDDQVRRVRLKRFASQDRHPLGDGRFCWA